MDISGEGSFSGEGIFHGTLPCHKLLYKPVKLAPKLRPDLNLFDLKKYESVWVECKSTFNISSKEKMLVNLCYNPSRSNFIDFLEQLTLNIDNAFSVSNKITLLGDYNINYLDSKEKFRFYNYSIWIEGFLSIR